MKTAFIFKEIITYPLFCTCQFWVNHDTTAVFANDDFLTRTDIQLLLRRNLVKATTTSITLNVYYAQTIA